MKKLVKRQFGGLLNLFKSTPSLQQPELNKKIPPRGRWTKMGPLEPDVPVNNTTYGPYNLPGITVIATNLKKAQPFPYGGINVESQNGQTIAYLTGANPLQEAVFKNKAKRQFAYRGKLMQHGGAFNDLPIAVAQKFQLNQRNMLAGQKSLIKGQEINNNQAEIIIAQAGNKIPKLNEWRFRRTTNNLNNGYKVISDQIMQTIENGQKTYDTPPITSGRTIYVTPRGNDTIFYRNKDNIFNHTPVGDKNQRAAKSYFYKMIKQAPIEGSEYRGTKYWTNNNAQVDAARNRALKGFKNGGSTKKLIKRK